MAYKLNKINFNFGEGTGSAPNKLSDPIGEAKEDAKKLHKYFSKSPKDRKKVFTTKNILKQAGNFITGTGGAGRFNPILGPAGLDVQSHIDPWKNNLKIIRQSKESKVKTEKTKTKSNEIKQEPKKEKIPAVGTIARKAYYDKKNWKYDDTIKGYNRDGTKK